MSNFFSAFAVSDMFHLNFAINPRRVSKCLYLKISQKPPSLHPILIMKKQKSDLISFSNVKTNAIRVSFHFVSLQNTE